MNPPRWVRLIVIAALPWTAHAAPACGSGLWADAMLGSHHIKPDRYFEDFNPGLGIECGLRPDWALAGGYFRNSLLRPSFYAGAIYAPESLHRGWVRLGAMGGVISGYNYGRFGVGDQHRTGLLLLPTAILGKGRFAANIILVPPIPQDDLPFTIALQAKFRIR